MKKEAIYENGKITFLDDDIPQGKMKVVIDFPDNTSLSDSWEEEINRRVQEVKDGLSESYTLDLVKEKFLSKYK